MKQLKKYWDLHEIINILKSKIILCPILYTFCITINIKIIVIAGILLRIENNNILPLFLSVKVLPPDICSIILSAGFREKNKCLKA
jgi:hypothetical protein